VGGTRGEIHEERLVRRQRALLADPGDRLVGHVLGEVIAVFGLLGLLDWYRALVDGRVPLVGLPTEEPVEVLEAASRRPIVVGAHGAGVPDRDLVTLAELGGVVAVELEDLRQRRRRLGPQRVVP